MPYKDKDKQKEFQQKWYQGRKEIHRLQNRKAKRKKADFIKQVKKDGCIICQEKEPACIDFHHIDPNIKDFPPSLIIRQKGIKFFIKELEKCVCLCANCHRKVHAKIIIIPENTQTLVVDKNLITEYYKKTSGV